MDNIETRRIIYNKIQEDYVEFIEMASENEITNTTIMLVTLPPFSKGVGLHYHKLITEEFTCIEGLLTLNVSKAGKQIINLKPNENFTAHPKTLHLFKNTTDKVCKFQCKISPANRNFELGLQIGYGLANSDKTDRWGVPNNPINLFLLINLTDTYLSGFRSVINPIAKFISKFISSQKLNELKQAYVKY